MENKNVILAEINRVFGLHMQAETKEQRELDKEQRYEAHDLYLALISEDTPLATCLQKLEVKWYDLYEMESAWQIIRLDVSEKYEYSLVNIAEKEFYDIGQTVGRLTETEMPVKTPDGDNVFIWSENDLKDIYLLESNCKF